MNCNKDIHNELIEMGEYDCPFCELQLMEVDVKEEYCCNKPDVIDDNSEIVCKNCGIVQGYKPVKEFIDFHENKYKLRRKSVYHRKYHIINIILNMNLRISYNDKEEIFRIFDKIEKLTPLIDPNRKRLISVNFLLKQIIKTYFPDINHENIRITKSQKTLKYYDDYWDKIVSLIQQ